VLRYVPCAAARLDDAQREREASQKALLLYATAWKVIRKKTECSVCGGVGLI
jgi:hypothetical protein